MKTLHFIFLFCCIVAVAHGQSAIPRTGTYSGDLLLAYDSASKVLTGFVEQYRVSMAEPDKRTAEFCCSAYFKGKRAGKNKFFTLTCFDPRTGSPKVINTGKLKIIGDSLVEITLKSEPEACRGMTDGLFVTGKQFRYLSPGNFVNLLIVQFPRATLYPSPKREKDSTLPVLTRGMIVRVLATKDSYVQCEYHDGIAGTTLSGWVRRETLFWGILYDSLRGGC